MTFQIGLRHEWGLNRKKWQEHFRMKKEHEKVKVKGVLRKAAWASRKSTEIQICV